HPPDHERGAEDQDPGLAQCLPEEPEDAPVQDVAEDRAAEPDDLPERGGPIPRYRHPAGHAAARVSAERPRGRAYMSRAHSRRPDSASEARTSASDGCPRCGCGYGNSS